MTEREWLTNDEMKELDGLLDRVESLSSVEEARLKELGDKNEKSLMPEIGVLLSVLCNMEEEGE